VTEQEIRPASSARILVVDDTEINLRLMRRILQHAGYTDIRTLLDGSEVLDTLDEFDPDLVLLDLHMPGKDGFDVLKDLQPRMSRAYLPVLMLTGDLSPQTKRQALALGAKDFLSKPFDTAEVVLRIQNLLETRFLYLSMEVRVRARTADLEQSQIEILERLARAAEIRDDDTGRHTQRVAELSAKLAEAAGLDSRFVDLVRRASPLHDVGKIGIPDNILRKPGKLTPKEMALMETHTTIGAQILSGGQSELVTIAERIAMSHHEWWNGAGYPEKIAGERIPIEARIVGIADFVDALSHDRPYRRAWPIEKVLDELESRKGTHFDPKLVETMITSRAYRRVSVTPPSSVRVVVAPVRTAQPDRIRKFSR
jgi:putative two-component system response regulator